MRPRTLAAVLLAVTLASAGCLGGVGQGSPSDSPTESPSEPSTPPLTTDSTMDVSFGPASFADGPKSEPDRPAELTESAVVEYVRTFEYRRVYNSLWMGEGTEMDLDCETHDVTSVEGGYDVLVSCTGYSNSGGDSDGDSTATPTVVHADWFTQYFVYRATDDSTERRRATEDERQSGTL